MDYTFKLGFIPYPTWTHACRDSALYNLYETTDKLLFVRPTHALVVAVAVVVTCVVILVVILRIFFIVRHVVDLKSRTAYNVLMLTDDEIADQIPTLDIIKSYKKECLIFAVELLLVIGIASSIVYALNILTN